MLWGYSNYTPEPLDCMDDVNPGCEQEPFPLTSSAAARAPAAPGGSGTIFYWPPVFHRDYTFNKIKDKLLGLVYSSVIKRTPVSQKRSLVFCSSSKGLQTL